MNSNFGQNESFSTRAKSPSEWIRAKNIEYVQTHSEFVHFQIHFEDDHTESLKIFPSEKSWYLQIGNKRNHDLEFKLERHVFKIDFTADNCHISCGSTTLSISFKNLGFVFRENHQIFLKSITEDLNLGNAEMSYPVFKHSQGYGLSFEMQRNEKFYGGGENFGPLLKNGRSYDLINSDAFGVHADRQYQSTPFFWSSRGYGICVTNSEPKCL